MEEKQKKKVGRKSTWAKRPRYFDTKTIRVPTELAPDILRLAHYLDDNKLNYQKLVEILSRLEKLDEELTSRSTEIISAHAIIESQATQINNLRAELEKINEF